MATILGPSTLTEKLNLAPLDVDVRNGIDKSTVDKYWRKPIDELKHIPGLVLIHVCDENRDLTRDFCCKRDILVSYMKYFEHFLVETENGYEDIDISVHCDIDIFEWLMEYIHSPQHPPPMDKTIVISILISSDFLQIEALVDMCLTFVAGNLGDIVKLPIDLSCLSEKLLTKLAQLTPAQLLAHTKDKKDKILNKLYKRRVEMDFSRKSSRSGVKSLASTLTCCVTCGRIYLDAFGNQLVCIEAETAMDFRGRLVRRHSPSNDWSLTSYLKLLHAGGMNWESIYWYVWAACAVFSKGGAVFSANECSRYLCEADVVMINAPSRREFAVSGDSVPSLGLETEDDEEGCIWPVKMIVEYSSSRDERCSPHAAVNSPVHQSEDAFGASHSVGKVMFSSLPITVLTPDLYGVLVSQKKFFEATQYEQLLETSVKTTLGSIGKRKLTDAGSMRFSDGAHFDFYDIIFESDSTSDINAGEANQRGRGRRGGPLSGKGSDRDSQQKRKARSTSAVGKGAVAAIASGSAAAAIAENELANSTRRSRSSGATVINRKAAPATAESNANTDEGSDENDDEEDAAAAELELLEKKFAVFHSMPTDVQSIASRYRGPACGVWLTSHPIQLCPIQFLQTLKNVHESSSLSDAKRDEWMMDLVREYDEKRMECFEDFLVNSRSNADIQINHSLIKAGGDGTSLKGKKDERSSFLKQPDYYKDRGRQPRGSKSYYLNR